MTTPGGEVTTRQGRLTNSYMLWLLWLFGFGGIHRIYNGKIGTGILWFLTWGMFGIGQVVDLFLMPDMAEEQQMKLMAKYGVSPFGVPSAPPAVAAQTIAHPTKEQQMVKLLKAAQQHDGKLSVTQGVMATEMSFADVEALLREMHKAGYVGVENHPETGIVTYRFTEL